MLQAAILLHQAGRLDEAELAYVQLLQIDANHADALYLLGLVAHQSHRHGDAVALVLRAIELQPGTPTFYNTLGDAYRLLSRLEEAEASLRRALELAPTSRDATTNLAVVLHAQGRLSEVMPMLMDALGSFAVTEPWPPLLRAVAVDALRANSFTWATATARQVLLRMCNDAEVPASALAEPALNLIRHTAAFAQLEESAPDNTTPFERAPQAVAELLAEPLLLALLPRIAVADEAIERVLTQLRRGLLHLALREGCVALAQREEILAFATVLAQQCFNTEYAWRVRDDETPALLDADIDWEVDGEADRFASAARALALSIGAAYAPLSKRADIDHIKAPPGEPWSASFHAMIKQQILEPELETQLSATLPSLTGVSNPVSQIVREMYEANPYPRWVDLERPGVLDTAQFISAISGRAALFTTARPSILVAGCGTGRQPIQVALQFADSDVLAIDLSRASLGYAAREALEHRVPNLTFAHADLLEIDLPERAFAIISCSGVLHHLADPLAGWRRLLLHLAAHGVMKIGLYSTKARRGVTAARTFVTDHGFGSSADDIRAGRHAILSLPVDHLARRVTRFPDFFSISGCRDLIMHVQERTYTARELADALDALDLRFLGFQTDSDTQARFAAMFPAAAAATDLECWDAFESEFPDTFAGMYQLWCDRRSTH